MAAISKALVYTPLVYGSSNSGSSPPQSMQYLKLLNMMTPNTSEGLLRVSQIHRVVVSRSQAQKCSYPPRWVSDPFIVLLLNVKDEVFPGCGAS